MASIGQIARRMRQGRAPLVTQPQAVIQPFPGPVSLYQPSDRDLRGTLIQPIFRAVEQTAASAALSNMVFTIPADQLWELHWCLLRANSGAGQQVSEMVIEILDAVLNNTICTIARESQSGFLNDELQAPQPLWLPPNSLFRARISFTAGVNANTGRLDIGGFIRPRGNVSAI